MFTPRTYTSRFCSGLCQQRIYRRGCGGQYAPAIGTSTQDVTDRERDAEALADFNAEWERIRFGTVAGREW